MLEVISNFIQQIVNTVGIIAVFGLLFSLCRRGFCKILGQTGVFITNYITGIVGTPVHELSHAFFCILFGHKIIEIDLFSPSDGNDSLGYVMHDYDENNIYHKIGMFFIGIGPIIGGSAVIILLMHLMTPNLYSVLTTGLNKITMDGNFIVNYIEIISETLPLVFNSEYFSSVWYWIFLILSLMIASHMELSGADIKGAKFGLVVLLTTLFIVDAVLYFLYPPALSSITLATSYFGLFIAKILIVGAIFSIALVLLAIIIKAIKNIIK